MRLAILNWRDIKNPKSGGAEILTHEISKRLIKKGHSVVQFSSAFPNCENEEIIDGVKIIRNGHPDLRTCFASVHFKAYEWYKKNSEDIDVVIDEIHGVPFFTSLYIRKKRIALICEFAGTLWDKAVAFPFNYIGKYVEKIYPIFYSSTEIVTISQSSKKEIQKELFRGKNIYVINPGCSTPIINKPISKPRNLNLLFISRLARTKGVEDAIEITRKLSEKGVKVTLHIIGRGEVEYVKNLIRRVKVLNLSKNILFYGYVSESKKIKIIDKSHILVLPSEKEGWGLTVHEVNSRGVPAIAYDIPGLRDVIKNNVNGYLVTKNIPEALSDKILTLFTNKKTYNLLAKKSISERRKFSWDNTTNELEKILNK